MLTFYGLRRVERRLPQPSHQTMYLPICTTTGKSNSCWLAASLLIETGNVPTNPCIHFTFFMRKLFTSDFISANRASGIEEAAMKAASSVLQA